MEQINTYGIYLLGKWMDSVFLHARVPLKQSIGAWQSLHALLSILIDGQAKIRLNESNVAARQLRDVIGAALADYTKDPELTLSDQQVLAFNNAWGVFEQILQVDLNRAPIYLVTPKGIYATDHLINGAQFALMREVFDGTPEEAKDDLNQAGRCLAFGIWTGAAFHAMRATEKVLRDWHAAVCGRPAGFVTMGHAITQLRAKDADPKTLAALDQLRDLHRNPVSHPEVFLTMSEAMELFAISTSAISAIVRQIAKQPKIAHPAPVNIEEINNG